MKNKKSLNACLFAVAFIFGMLVMHNEAQAQVCSSGSGSCGPAGSCASVDRSDTICAIGQDCCLSPPSGSSSGGGCSGYDVSTCTGCVGACTCAGTDENICMEFCTIGNVCGSTSTSSGGLSTSSGGIIWTTTSGGPMGPMLNPGMAVSLGLPITTLYHILYNVLLWLLGIVGVLGILGFTISGILYLVSVGDQDRIELAKKTMTYSIIGIIVSLLGFSISLTIYMILTA